MLEVRDPGEAAAAVEAALRDAGFFGEPAAAGGLVADVYFGYGASAPLRRSGAAGPPEPCAELPLAACSVRRAAPGEAPWQAAPAPARAPAPPAPAPAATARSIPYRVGSWQRSWTDAGYAAAIDAVREAIRRGDVYQVNLVQHLSAPFDGDPAALAAALAPLRPLEPRPLAGEGWTIVSASPEVFLRRRGDRVWTLPIKGTRRLGAEEGLRGAEKDGAEHMMIVDLERNDLSRVCEPGTVRWPELMAQHELAGVSHLVSTVEGRLRPGVGLAELLAATFPGGSVTGAPKIAALDLIAALEPVGRGASMGAIGRVWPNGDLDLALTIRTFAVAGGRIHLWVGGGIVWDSVAADEIEESWVKARPLCRAIGAPLEEGAAA